MCLDKLRGGLGVREIKNFNLKLLCKWLWRWVLEEKSLWVSVVKSRYRWLSVEIVSELDTKGWSLWWKDVHELWWGRVVSLFRDNISLSSGE